MAALTEDQKAVKKAADERAAIEKAQAEQLEEAHKVVDTKKAREDYFDHGFRSEHFRVAFHGDNAFIAKAEWIGPEALIVNKADLGELTDVINTLDHVFSDQED